MTKYFATLDGIKRAAKKLGRERSIPHHQALDEVARDAGFQNFVHASRAHAGAVTSGAVIAPRYTIIVQQQWRDREARRGGTERLTMTLSRPLDHLVKPHHYKGYLSGSQVQDGNRLVGFGGYESQERARHQTCKLARTLQFMDVTGLTPTDARRAFPKGAFDNRIPGADHHHQWYHADSKSYVMTDEPYPGQTHYHAEERALWQERFDHDIVQVDWGSIYGLGTELWLSARRGGPFDLAAAIERLMASVPAITQTEWDRLQAA